MCDDDDGDGDDRAVVLSSVLRRLVRRHVLAPWLAALSHSFGAALGDASTLAGAPAPAMRSGGGQHGSAQSPQQIQATAEQEAMVAAAPDILGCARRILEQHCGDAVV
eukprot:COSAG01_NODE_12304_length_1763_cov_1.643029_1_plen_108_part_00